MAKKTSQETIKDVSFVTELSDRYLAYALSTITSRSLPDVRDGLKPVHRRLLYAMLQLKLDPKSGFKKCARVVGDVIGKYHPHGDVAVYDAMVRLAQNFAVRYPLVEGQGNFGSIDGDNAAAMRYTEARLTEVALALLQDITYDTVPFHETYDGSEQEPSVLPSAFPNLLANGTEGIAVGMATSIPPHNAGELCDALLHLIKHPSTPISNLVNNFIPGPDFPTGGMVIESNHNMVKAYETGKGSFRLRAKWEREELSHGLYHIVVTELPYQVQKSRLMEKIADIIRGKKLPILANIRDESVDDIRVILEPKNRSVDANMLMESLFKLTDLETRISLNMNVLTAEHYPKVMNLREALQSFLDHRHDVLVRKSTYRLGKIDHRLEVLDGLLIAYLNLDEVIRIIREEDEPKALMMKKWKLSDVQVEAILNMRLRNLRKLEEMEIRHEHDTLSAEKDALQTLLNDETLRWKAIAEEIKETKKQFGQATELGARRTHFADAPTSTVVSIEAFVEKEPITIICSKLGWIRSFKGHAIEETGLKYKEGDKERYFLKAYTTDKLLIFASNGKFYTLGCDKIPGGKGHGDAVRVLFEMDQNDHISTLAIHKPGDKLLVASRSGKGFIVPQDAVIAQTKSGKQILNLPEGDAAITAVPVHGDSVAVVGENRKLLIFSLDELPEMKRGGGVRMQKFKDGGLSDVKTFTKTEGLSWNLGERVRTEEDITPWIGKRASAGRLPPNGFPKNNKF